MPPTAVIGFQRVLAKDAPLSTSAVTSALWTFGPPSGIGCCQDSAKLVAWSTNSAIAALGRDIGTDANLLAAACAEIRAFVAARSSDPYDLEQAERACRALRRCRLVACIRRHPRAVQFTNLATTIARGRATAAQMRLAETLAAEAA